MKQCYAVIHKNPVHPRTVANQIESNTVHTRKINVTTQVRRSCLLVPFQLLKEDQESNTDTLINRWRRVCETPGEVQSVGQTHRQSDWHTPLR